MPCSDCNGTAIHFGWAGRHTNSGADLWREEWRFSRESKYESAALLDPAGIRVDGGGNACCRKDPFDIPRRSGRNNDEIPAVGFEMADTIGELRVGFRVSQKSIQSLRFGWRKMIESLHGLEMRDAARSIIGEIVAVIVRHVTLGDERVDVAICDGAVEVGNEGGIVHALSHNAYRNKPINGRDDIAAELTSFHMFPA